ncbi:MULTISPECIES: SLOG family protein [Pseudomonas]|uniref:SLOG family protein n=1 Tax=Pseudomonas TaxID=286 RepID=UPI001F031644|nr:MULTISPECIES: SLOG family protein [Pseudomonas]MCG8294356.1 SLOG family protein [Pseudomonas entomophila]
MRVLICAGRNYADSRRCRQALDDLQRRQPIRVLIHGGSQHLGGDIEAWAREHGADIVRYPPNWQLHGKLAERLRNVFMLRDSRPDAVLALPGGDDTEELLARARGAGIAVVCAGRPLAGQTSMHSLPLRRD